jgi:hypothetical protein
LIPGDGLARCGCHSQGAASRAAQPVEFEDFRVALAMLPSGQREALLLVGASGFSYYEAAAICESAVSGCYIYPTRCVGHYGCCGTVKCHQECYFPQFPTALTNDKPDLHLRSGIAIIPPPRPAFVGGKGSPCEKKKGSLCEEES